MDESTQTNSVKLFFPGARVRLRSGGVPMTVKSISPSGDGVAPLIRCIHQEKRRTIHSVFKLSELVPS